MKNRWDNILKILFGIEFILIVLIIALALADNKSTPTAYAVKEIPIENDFKIATRAVCENKTDGIFCHDELFAKCNGIEYLIADTNLENFTCNNVMLNLSSNKISGFAAFGEGWTDPR